MRLPDVRNLVHDSQLLRGNPWGDPHERVLPVYVPPGYDPDRKIPYPVVYLLAGWGGRGARFLNDEGVFASGFAQTMDRLIERGEMPAVICVFPDCGTRLGASQYVNSVANGPYMDYLCDELVPFIDTTFNTFRDPAHRGILGHSSGGFGALVTCMKRPDRFGLLCSSAGDSWYEYLYVHPIPTMMRVIARAGGIEALVEKYLSSPNPAGLLPREMGETLMCLSMCSCYVPNLSVPGIKGDLYFDLETGELDPKVWPRFLAWDPVHMVPSHVGALKQLRWIHLEAGTEDEYGLHVGHRRIARALSKHGIAPVVDEYPGRHGGHHHRMPQRIARMLTAMPTALPVATSA